MQQMHALYTAAVHMSELQVNTNYECCAKKLGCWTVNLYLRLPRSSSSCNLFYKTFCKHVLIITIYIMSSFIKLFPKLNFLSKGQLGKTL